MKKRTEVIQKCLALVLKSDQCSDEYDVACYALSQAMMPGHRDTLRQLVKSGPVHDGDIISKSHRDDLLQWGLAGRAHVNGEQGYTVANYRGGNVNTASEQMA